MKRFSLLLLLGFSSQSMAFVMHAGTWSFSPNRYVDFPTRHIEHNESFFCIGMSASW